MSSSCCGPSAASASGSAAITRWRRDCRRPTRSKASVSSTCSSCRTCMRFPLRSSTARRRNARRKTSRPSPSAAIWRAVASASTRAARTARFPPSSTARPSIPRRSSGTPRRNPTRSITLTASFPRSARRRPRCRAWTVTAFPPRAFSSATVRWCPPSLLKYRAKSAIWSRPSTTARRASWATCPSWSPTTAT